jgi:hypothetical protein
MKSSLNVLAVQRTGAGFGKGCETCCGNKRNAPKMHQLCTGYAPKTGLEIFFGREIGDGGWDWHLNYIIALMTPLQKGCDKSHPNCTLLR